MSDSFLDKKRSWITDDRKPGEELSVRDAALAMKEGFQNFKDMAAGQMSGKYDYSDSTKVEPTDPSKYGR